LSQGEDAIRVQETTHNEIPITIHAPGEFGPVTDDVV
jgi:hypothetical protein